MSTELHTTQVDANHNHSESHHSEKGVMKSYVIGFILSLVLTINPYFLVVTKTVTGNALIATIFAFALLQMFVQLFFFLHLGRGPKPLYNVVFFFATAGIIVLTVGAALFIMNNLYRNMSPDEVTQKLAQNEAIAQIGGEATGACKTNEENHRVTISNGVITPSYTEAKRCDTLTILNDDNISYDMVFGSYPIRRSYGGEDNVSVRKGKAETITLNQIGMHGFYDDKNPDVSGSINVTE